MTVHLREAIHLNRERRPAYARLTEGRSERISDRLILAERIALFLARWVDARAAPYERRGIGVTCDAFVPMDRTPPMREEPVADPPSLERFEAPEMGAMRRRVTEAYRAEGFPGASRALEAGLSAVQGEPAFHCMVRHVLESSLRITDLAPVHAARAREAGMRSPERLSWLMLRAHLLTLEESARLDRWAAPIQAAGVPILCQDVPPIDRVAPHQPAPAPSAAPHSQEP